MKIIISNSNKEPIYEQISRQIKDLIMNGSLQAGDALPSMRLLAKELRISMLTTKHAYEELEREGYIESYVGKGSFVKSANQDFIQEQNRKAMETALVEAIGKAGQLRMSKEEFLELAALIFDEE